MPKRKNEFLRQRPAQQSRNVLYDISNFVIPVLIVLAGLVIFAQTFAKQVGYDFSYTSPPFYVTGRPIFFIPKGYPFFNPLLIILHCTAHPFDPLVNRVIIPSLFPFLACAVLAVVAFFVISFIRGAGLNKSKNLYGTARWASERDLKKFGLTEASGVILAQFQRASLDFAVNPKNSSISLKLKKPAPLICHQGGTNTLTIAPTRSGKGVGSIIPTCLSYPQSMIVFDPKGELFEATSGFRRQFSRILKFSPISRDTVRFNPLEEVELTEQAFADIGLILTNMFEQPKGEQTSTSSFFDNNAQDLLTGLIFHILTSRNYAKEQKNLNGVLSVLSQAASQETTNESGEQTGLGDELLHEMKDSPHYDKYGRESPYIHKIVSNVASRILGMHFKVRSDVFSTVFSRMRLFEDPYIAYVTGESDFRLQDFYDSGEPITLYLTVPFSDIKRIAPVFRLLVSFMLNKFSRGEASYGSAALKHRILFLLDEFKTLGPFPFLSDTMGILAGYGITFYIVVQALNQIVDLYGQQHTFLDNCKTVMVYAPGKYEDAKAFSDMIGRESVLNENLSVSGSRYSVSLNNLNASGQEVARELMNPDELMKLPPTEALILNQGMPAYIAKKCVYYEDRRFMKNAYSRRELTIRRFLGVKIKAETASFLEKTFLKPCVTTGKKEITTGFAPPASRKELEAEAAGLPSQIEKRGREKKEKNPEPAVSDERTRELSEQFDPLNYIEQYDGGADDYLPASCAAFSGAGGDAIPEGPEEGQKEEKEQEEDAPRTIYETFAIDSSYFAEPGEKYETVTP
jgi:type IV secretion system protein VirD4